MMQYASTGASAERVMEWVSELAHPLGGYEICCLRDDVSKLEGLQPNPINNMVVVSEYLS